MKRGVTLLILSAALLLTACAVGQSGSHRPASRKMTFTVEGAEETQAVSLWQEERFSMYVPTQSWSRDERDVWRPEGSEDVALFVTEYADLDADAVHEAILTEYESYGFTLVENDCFTGYDSGAGMTLWVKLVAVEDGCLALCAQYPTAAAEGHGARLQQLAETFEAV